jgi:hypothetical protein
MGEAARARALAFADPARIAAEWRRLYAAV